MEQLKSWLLSLIAVAFLLSAAEYVSPEGGPKKMLRCMGGCLLLVILFRPLIPLQDAENRSLHSSYTEKVQAMEECYEAKNRESLAMSIAGETASYIEAKAAGQGLSCKASVQASWKEETESFGIDGICLYGEENAAFTAELAASLALDAEDIIWEAEQ